MSSCPVSQDLGIELLLFAQISDSVGAGRSALERLGIRNETNARARAYAMRQYAMREVLRAHAHSDATRTYAELACMVF